MDMNKMEVLNACDGIANELHSLKIAQLVKEARETVIADRKANILFTGQTLPLLLGTVQAILNTELLPQQEFAYIDRACRFVFTYNETGGCCISADGTAIGCNASEIIEAIKQAEPASVPEIILSLENEALIGQNISVLFSYNEFVEFNWKKEFNHSEFVFLITNATAAMNMNERNFIETCVKGFLGGMRFGIILCNLELLNTDADMNVVIDSVHSYNKLSNLDCRIFNSGQEELRDFVRTQLAAEIEELHTITMDQAILNCINEIDEAVKEIEEDAKLDNHELDELISELEKRKGKIETAGRIAASTLSGNFSAKLKYELTMDISKYNEEALDNIRKAVETSKDIAATKKKIPNYLADIWENFEREQDKKLKKDTQVLIDNIYVKMEQDVGEFFQDVSESKRKVLEYAMSYIAIERGPIPYNPKESSTEKTIGKMSKIMLWGSIPVAFLISLPLGIATAVGSKAVKSFSQKTIDAENKEAIMQEVNTICNITKTEILKTADHSIDNIVHNIEAEIIASYKKFAEAILLELNRMHDKAVEAEKLMTYINGIKVEILPEIKEKLN